MDPVTDKVIFQVGEIVHHLRYGYRGVIVGHDTICKAADDWYEFQTKGKSYKPTRKQPWYHVLVDGSTTQTYVAQQNLEPGDSTYPIDHPMLEHVFTAFLDGRYHRESLN